MSRFLFVSYAATGHLTPTLAVARALVRRGHSVAMLTAEQARATVEASGVRLLAARSWDASPGRAQPEAEPLPPLKALLRLRRLIREMFFGEAPHQVHDLRSALSQWSADLVIGSEVTPGVSLAMEQMQRKWATLAVQVTCTLPSRDLFPWGYALPTPKADLERARAALARGVYGLLSLPLELEWSALRTRYHLPGSANLAHSFGSPHLYLIPSSRQFDAPRSDLPRHVHYIGPCFGPPTMSHEWHNPFLEGRPLVYATAGTIFNHRDFLSKLIESARGQAFDLFVTVGNNNDLDQFPELPSNVRLERFVPQDLILPQASAVLCNGGSGAVMGALLHGRPLVVLPIAADQPENARRAVELGVGRMLRQHPLQVPAIREAITQVLNDPSYRSRAERLAANLAKLDGPARGASLLEELAARATRPRRFSVRSHATGAGSS